MFRDGQYLEVIKASDNCLATAVVTVQERTIEIKKQKVVTNKWLQVEDWAALYKILQRAILRNGRDNGSDREGQRCEWRKSIRRLEVTYSFEHPEHTSDTTSLPTIKVHVSAARKKSVKPETSVEIPKAGKVKPRDDSAKRIKEDKSSDLTASAKSDRFQKETSEKPMQTSTRKIETARTIATEDLRKKRKRKYDFPDDLRNVPLEEYIPDAPKAKKSCVDFKYVPSRKSVLERTPLATYEYTPTLCDGKYVPEDVDYVPNSIEKLEATYETYEPRAITIIPNDILKEYVPNSKGVTASVEEYEPDFKSPSKLMKFDDSYVPSSVRHSLPNNFRGVPDGSEKPKMQKIDTYRKGSLSNKKMGLFS